MASIDWSFFGKLYLAGMFGVGIGFTLCAILTTAKMSEED